MKKFSKWLLLPLGVSLLLPGALTSADSKTSGDFKDLAGIDAALKTKIDALLQKGVFEGVSNDSFGIDQNMTRAQFAKVLTLIYGVKADDSVTTSSFADVKADDAANGWAIKYIEAAKKAGLVDGKSDTSFDPGANLTLGEFSTALVKGLGVKPDMSGTPWYADAVKQAIDKKVLPEGTDGAKLATRVDLVVGAYSGQQVFEELKLQASPSPSASPSASPTPSATPSPTPTSTPTPDDSSESSDTTAPSILSATVNGSPVTITGGSSGSITLASDGYLTSGTITSDEDATFRITSVQGVSLTNYPSLTFTQQLTAGAATPLDLVTFLGSLDSQGDGVSVSRLKSLTGNEEQLNVTGTLTDAAGNTRQVALTFHWSE